MAVPFVPIAALQVPRLRVAQQQSRLVRREDSSRRRSNHKGWAPHIPLRFPVPWLLDSSVQRLPAGDLELSPKGMKGLLRRAAPIRSQPDAVRRRFPGGVVCLPRPGKTAETPSEYLRVRETELLAQETHGR